MTTVEKIFSALAWWFGIFGLVGLFIGFSGAARKHCVLGLTVNVIGIAANRLLGGHNPVPGVLVLISLLYLIVAIINTIAAISGKGPFFTRA